jgi:hypothetical protein
MKLNITPALGMAPKGFARSFVTLGLALYATLSALGQTATTVDDVQDGWAAGIAANAAGDIFVAGDVASIGGHISKSSDLGATWTASDTGAVGYYNAIATATVTTPSLTVENHVVAAGQIGGQWIARRSLDAGATWTTIDTYAHPTSNRSSWAPELVAVGIDSQGNVYVAGYAAQLTTVRNKTVATLYWLIRRIGADGSLAAYDLYDTGGGGLSRVTGIACVGTDVFAAGISGDRWQVRKSINGGATWSLEDNYRFNASYPSEAHAITADSAGNLYVVGTGRRQVGKGGTAITPGYFIVRKGTGLGGASFQTIDQFELEPNRHAAAYGVTVDAAGGLHVTGQAFGTVNGSVTSRFVTRYLSSPSESWVTTDVFSTTGLGRGIAVGTAGNVFSAGGAAGHDWVVRRVQP